MSDFDFGLEAYRAKLLPGEKNHYGYMLPEVRPVTDEKKMTATVTISTERPDRSREVLVANGGYLENHKGNPVVLLNHQKLLPTGKAEDRETKAYTVQKGQGRLDAVTYFDQHTQLGEHGFELVNSGTFRGLSVGFLEYPNAIEKGHDSRGPVRIIKEWELLEYSHLLIPDNPDCLVRAVEKGFGGKPLNATLRDYLIPFIPKRPVVVQSGWEVKAMDLATAGGTMGNDGSAMDDDNPQDPDDAEEVSLTGSSQFYHLVHAGITQLIGMVEEMQPTLEGERTKGDAEAIVAKLAAVLDMCADGHGEHKQEYPDQPSLPNDPGTDNSDETEKSMEHWRQKGLEAWQAHVAGWEQWVSAQDANVVLEAVDLYTTMAKDPRLPGRVRAKAKVMGEKLADVRMVQGQGGPKNDDDEDWSIVMAECKKDSAQ